MRVCPTPGCPELIDAATRCPTCSTQHEQQRGTRTQRGYGAKHKALRKRWARKVAAGNVTCWRCGERISPLEPFDLGHDDHDRTQWRGPEHQACNRATANR